jgi:phospholipid/cholesterol/gamma-HCH transport system permease protein
MKVSKLRINTNLDNVVLYFTGEFTIYKVNSYQLLLDKLDLNSIISVKIDFSQLDFLDSAAAIFINNFKTKIIDKNIFLEIIYKNKEIKDILALVQKQKGNSSLVTTPKKINFLQSIGQAVHEKLLSYIEFMHFFGNLFMTNIHYLASIKNIRYKEIFFEINESGVKALGIIALTSFLIGLVVAYQSAYQLKIYGANIFIVDMLGISILRELAPLITAIVIAGRSGSAFTAQIGAMKITQELDAMRTMGFDPYKFLVLPRIIALMITLPILIFVADIMGIFGGMLVASLDLGITSSLFLERFHEVIQAKHFFIGLLKGPFFAFLIASIGIYRGLMVKDDTQSIGFNTTKSVVESIFAVIICDALFSITLTSLGI